MLATPTTHTKARSPHPQYPQRFVVPDNMVSWNVPFLAYNPTDYTAKVVHDNDNTKKANGWADPVNLDDEQLLSRKSYSGKIKFTEHLKPQNPVGRTGMRGRGLLGKWGPNHAADPIVTRLNPKTQKLEMVAIQRVDTGEWAIPGGMVDAGERITATLKREFAEEAMGNMSEEEQEKFGIKKQLDDLFSIGGIEVYKGYVDDPRNTDNAWMETVAVHFHCPPSLGDHLYLKAADDAKAVQWLQIEDNPDLKLYASHELFVRHVVSKFREEHPVAPKSKSQVFKCFGNQDGRLYAVMTILLFVFFILLIWLIV